MKKIVTIFFTSLFIFSPLSTQAEVYKYINDIGQEWFVDRTEIILPQYLDQLKKSPFDVVSNTQSGLTSHDHGQTQFSSATTVEESSSIIEEVESIPTAFQKDIEIFVIQGNSKCSELENFLKSQNIKFKKYDVIKSNEGREKMRAMFASGVPVIKVGEEVIRGFQSEKILSSLTIQ